MLDGIYLSTNKHKQFKGTSAEAGSIPFDTVNVEGPKDSHWHREFIYSRGTAVAARLGVFQAHCKSPGVSGAHTCVAEIHPNVTEAHRKPIISYSPYSDSPGLELVD